MMFRDWFHAAFAFLAVAALLYALLLWAYVLG